MSDPNQLCALLRSLIKKHRSESDDAALLRALNQALEASERRHNDESIAEACWPAVRLLINKGFVGEACALAFGLGGRFPPQAGLCLSLGRASLQIGDLDAARLFTRAGIGILQESEQDDLHSLLRAWAQLADLPPKRSVADEASVECVKAPASGRRWHSLGFILNRERRYAEAERAFRLAVQNAPHDASHARAHTDALVASNQNELAIVAAADYLMTWPAEVGIRFARSRALKRLGCFAEAIEEARRCLPFNSAPRGLYEHLMSTLIRDSRENEALVFACDLVDTKGLSSLPLSMVGVLLRQDSTSPSARRLADLVSRAAPNPRLGPGLARALAPLPEPMAVPALRVRIADGANERPRTLAVFENSSHAILNKGTVGGRTPNIDLIEAKNVDLYIFPNGFLIFDDSGKFFDIFAPYVNNNLFDYIKTLPFCEKIEKLFIASDGKSWSRNYCHWIVDYIPRLLWARNSRPAWPIGLASFEYTGFRHETLEYLGFQQADILSLRIGRYKIDRLAALSTSSANGFRHSFHAGNKKYASPVIDAFDTNYPSATRRIFLTRPPGQGRSFLNYQEVMDLCHKYGFDVIDPGSLNFRDQIYMMRDASHVAGPHGAGLTNIFFCKNGTQILEIFPHDMGVLSFANICAVKDHDYSIFVGEKPQVPSRSDLDGNRVDFLVDCRKLAAAFDNFLAK